MSYAKEINSISRATASGTVAVVTVGFGPGIGGHPFKVGDRINIFGVASSVGTVGFSDGNPYTVTSVTGDAYDNFGGGTKLLVGYQTLTYNQTVPSNYQGASGSNVFAITAGSVIANSKTTFRVTTSPAHNLSTVQQPNIGISGVTDSNSRDGLASFNSRNVPATIINSTTIEFRVKPVDDWTGITFTAGSVYVPTTSGVCVSADGINARSGQAGASGINNNWSVINKGLLEGTAIIAAQQLAANAVAFDYPMRRLVDLSDTSKVSTSRLLTTINISQPPATFRSVLDSIVETYGGVDAKKRRYFIDTDGIFNYSIIDDTKPASATAPYKIVTANAGTPNASLANSSVAPFSLEVSYDHDTTKRAMFSASNSTGAPITDFVRYDSTDALGTAATRKGAPIFDDLVEYPTGTSSLLASRQTGARSYFLERAAPILTGSFTLRGAGTQSWNNLGFTSGYATISSPTATTVNLGKATTVAGDSFKRVASASDWANIAVGMQVVVTGWIGSTPTLFNGTATVTDIGRTNLTNYTTGIPFSYNGGSVLVSFPSTEATPGGYQQAVVYGLFVRTGTAPNQIVTVTLPQRHNIATGASVIVTGLTGAAGTSMNGTVTATVTSDYAFTYPSTGTNGTAGGSATLSSITLVPRWMPGQWVDITDAEKGLSGLYRVEQVDWRLEPGSYNQVVTVIFNRRNSKLLTRIIASKGKK